MVSGGMVVTDGLKIMLDRTFNSTPTRLEPSQFKVGDGTTTVVVGDTGLENPVPISGTETVDNCDAIAGWVDSADCTLSLNTTTFIEGTGSLNWTKDGTTTTSCQSAKTIAAALDFTSKSLSLFVYVKDATMLAYLTTSDCVEVRFGSDAANYYWWKFDKSDLVTGSWNNLDGMTSATATAVGSPVIGSCDYIYVDFVSNNTSDVWSAGDLIVDGIVLASSDDYLKDFESGYPELDYTALAVKARLRISTVQANGFKISEVGVFNKDGTPLLHSRDVFAGISKSQTDELIFIVTNTLE